VKRKVKNMFIIFFDNKGIIYKEFVLAGQTVNSAYYRDFYSNYVKICKDSGDKRTGCCITTTHRLTFPFSPANFLPKATRQSTPTNPTFLFSQLNIKLKVLHFDTTEVIEAESQAVLNTLTEQDFQDPFRKWHKCWEQCIHTARDYFEGYGCQ
jgi:hypothetical protein